jgi:2-methylcitrate dehydratase PrpD
LGVFGASAVAAEMFGMDRRYIAYAMSIAGSYASGNIQSGGDFKRVRAGIELMLVSGPEGQ